MSCDSTEQFLTKNVITERNMPFYGIVYNDTKRKTITGCAKMFFVELTELQCDTNTATIWVIFFLRHGILMPSNIYDKRVDGQQFDISDKGLLYSAS